MCFLIHLKGVNVPQPVLHVAVHHQFAQTQHLSAEMEGIPKPGLLSFLWKRDILSRKSQCWRGGKQFKCVFITSSYALLRFYLRGQRLHRLQVEVVVQMQVVEILTVDQQIEHVVALPAHLQPHFHPVQLGGLEELCGFEGSEEVPGSQQEENQIMSQRLLQFKDHNTTMCRVTLTSSSEPLVVCV